MMCIGTRISWLGCGSWRVEKSNGRTVKHAEVGRASGGATISNALLSNSSNDIPSLRNWWWQSLRFDNARINHRKELSLRGSAPLPPDHWSEAEGRAAGTETRR